MELTGGQQGAVVTEREAVDEVRVALKIIE